MCVHAHRQIVWIPEPMGMLVGKMTNASFQPRKAEVEADLQSKLASAANTLLSSRFD